MKHSYKIFFKKPDPYHRSNARDQVVISCIGIHPDYFHEPQSLHTHKKTDSHKLFGGATLPPSELVYASRRSFSGCPINYKSYFTEIFNDTSEETLERAYKLWVRDCKTVLEEEPAAL